MCHHLFHLVLTQRLVAGLLLVASCLLLLAAPATALIRISDGPLPRCTAMTRG